MKTLNFDEVTLTFTAKDGAVTTFGKDVLKSVSYGQASTGRGEGFGGAVKTPSYQCSFEMQMPAGAWEALYDALERVAPPFIPVSSRAQVLREARLMWSSKLRSVLRYSIPKRWFPLFEKEYMRCRDQRLHHVVGKKLSMKRKAPNE